ncbi:unnamed protein product [Ixodes pacificus]
MAKPPGFIAKSPRQTGAFAITFFFFVCRYALRM